MPTSGGKRVALVTGGSRGIGLGVATALAASGFDVAINGRREPGEVAGVIGELKSLGVDAIYCQGDVADLADHARMLGDVRDRFGRLDVLVNNAGVAPDVRADMLDATPESFDRLIRINLRGPYFLTQAAARWMVEQRKADAALPRLRRERLVRQRDRRLAPTAATTASARPASRWRPSSGPPGSPSSASTCTRSAPASSRPT